MVAVVQRAVKHFLKGLGGNCLSAAVRTWPDGQPNHLRILMYHRIDLADSASPLAPCTLSATPSDFAQQMEMLRCDFRPVSWAEVSAALRGETRLPPKAVMVTFDDAYRCFAAHAWPVLRARSIPVTLFVPTAYPDSPDRVFWWDALHWGLARRDDRSVVNGPNGPLPLATPDERQRAFRQLSRHIRRQPFRDSLKLIDSLLQDAGPAPGGQVSGWDELRRLQQEGVVIAPHTHSHPILDRIPPDEARREIRASCQDLRQELDECPSILAYPGGFTDATVARIVSELGLEAAVTTRRGAHRLPACDPLHLRRINVSAGTTPEMLRLQLSLAPQLFNALAALTE
jgi:peptidoglycan/xylan/chitin deacetylase (PgdA/CDA1 family)